MNETEETSNSSQNIECGEEYDHTDYGRIKVVGIWQETEWVDTVHDAPEDDVVIIRFLPPEGEDWGDEQPARLDEFREAVD